VLYRDFPKAGSADKDCIGLIGNLGSDHVGKARAIGNGPQRDMGIEQ
jgi:hypothetical protein